MDETKLEHETAFKNLASRRQLCGGRHCMIDADTGLVSAATVWLHGDVWFFDHYDRDHPHYWREYMFAARQRGTLWRPRINS